MSDWTLKQAARCDDMHHGTLGLRIAIEADGDVVVTLEECGRVLELEDGRMARFELCTSGGLSHRTRHALVDLLKAMKEDNMADPSADRTDARRYPRR